MDPLLEALPPQKAPIVWRQSLQAFNSRQSLGLRKKGKYYKIIRQQHQSWGTLSSCSPKVEGWGAAKPSRRLANISKLISQQHQDVGNGEDGEASIQNPKSKIQNPKIQNPRCTSLIGYHTSLIGYHTSLVPYHTSLIGYHTSLIGYHTSLIGYPTSLIGHHTSLVPYDGDA